MTNLLKMAVDLPPLLQVTVSGVLGIIGLVVFLGAVICLARAANRQEKLHLSSPVPMDPAKGIASLSPAFHNPSTTFLSGIK